MHNYFTILGAEIKRRMKGSESLNITGEKVVKGNGKRNCK
jgi:hypothetical protein